MGKNVANPTAMVLSASLMLRHLGLESQANSIAGAVYDVMCVHPFVCARRVRTRQLMADHNCLSFSLQPRWQGPHR
jgi:isocitrate/isopropylmalate dehydrogenase